MSNALPQYTQSNAPYGSIALNVQASPMYGRRENGTLKGNGWLGMMKRPDGGISSELSAGVNIGGQDMDIPLVVPGLTSEELDHLLKTDPTRPDYFKILPRSILHKAIAHATKRLMEGHSPFNE